MANTKYIGDYRLENVTNPRTGRIVTKPVYRGEWFAFAADAARVRRMKWIVPALSLVIALSFITVLLLNAPCGHLYYVMVPFALMIFPVFFQVMGCYRLLTAGERVTREHRDKLTGRLNGCPLIMAFLSAVSACGHAMYAVQVGFVFADGVSAACTGAILVSSLALFARRDALKMVCIGRAQ